MEGISYFRPDDAIEIFNIIIDNPNSEDVVITNGLWGKSTLTHQALLKKISRETRKTVNTLSGFRKTLETIRKLLLIEGLDLPHHYSPASVLREITRFQTDKSFAFQMETIEIFEAWKVENEPELRIPLLNALNSLFVVGIYRIGQRGRQNCEYLRIV